MKRAIVPCGVSGVGKTYTRTHDPELRGLSHVDIADIYRNYPEMDWFEALYALSNQIIRLLQLQDCVVVEGYCLSGSESRGILSRELRLHGIKFRFVELWAPIEVCLDRLQAQWDAGEMAPAVAARRVDLPRKC